MLHKNVAACLLLLLGLAAGPDFTTDAQAREPEVTCAWCGWVDLGNGPFHMFFTGTDLCGFPKPGPFQYSTVECSRCGGTTECHTSPQDGYCHLACGGENLRATAATLTAAVERGDPEEVRRLLGADFPEVSVRFSADAGRIEVTADCDPHVVGASIPVPPELSATLAAR